MNQTFKARSFTLIALLLFLGTQGSKAGLLKNWVNTSGGSWFDPNNWSPNSVPTNGDVVTITNNGTYTVYAPTGTVTCTVFTIGGASGKQTFVYGSATGGQILMTNTVVQNNGVLVITNGGVTGAVLVNPGGELDFNSQSSMSLNNLALTNRGTVAWTNGNLITSVSGTLPANTFITNSGLWQVATPQGLSLSPGGGNISYFYNSGTVQKTSSGSPGDGNTLGITFINLPTGVVNVTSGVLNLAGEGTNIMGGTFATTSPGSMIFSGNQTDSGSAMNGTGHFQFMSGNLYLRTNINPELALLNGQVYITGATTFQQGGVITSLALGGATLHGTNQIAGTMTVSGGSVMDQLTVLPGGQLLSSGLNLHAPLFMNLGIVVSGGSGVTYGGTPTTVISNGGTWNFVNDSYLQSGGVEGCIFTNAGLVEKTGGYRTSFCFGFPFVNLPSGIIRVETGTIGLPAYYTNQSGELQLAGGAFVAGDLTTNGMTGGILDGLGTISSAAIYDGGTISPEPLIQFNSSLTLGTNVILQIDGIGTESGISYDQLSVAGMVAISNATLQVTSLPDVPLGTEFVIIANTTANPTMGRFKGLPENAQLIISGQPFRIHYSGGDGNDVVLTRDSSAELFSGGYMNNAFKLLGVGGGSTLYTIQASTNFLQWTNVGIATGDVSGSFIFTDTNAPNFRYRFYRTTN